MGAEKKKRGNRKKPAWLYFNRELSWLQFNQRVLEEAMDPTVPLLERLKFLAITASNLDEFFKVRVGGLQQQKKQRRTSRDPAGLTPHQQLQAISRHARQMVHDQYDCFLADLAPALHTARIREWRIDQLDAEQLRYMERTFTDLIYPVITPMAVRPDQPFPLLVDTLLHVAFVLEQPAKAAGATTDEPPPLAVIPLPSVLPRFLTLPTSEGYGYVLLEEVVQWFSETLFHGRVVKQAGVFRLTRNADLSVREDEAPDLLAGMEMVLDERRVSDCIRLGVEASMPPGLIKRLQAALQVESPFLFRIPGPLDLADYMRLASMSGFEEYQEAQWTPICPPDLRPPESMFATLRQRDVLLIHPYESFEPVVRLVDEAADDPGVLAIKQTLYRTSADSPVVAALARAAEKGKHVTALVELKARFDEARNMEWARALERVGVQVIYGVRGLKTHAKVCIIIRREATGIQRYVHFGTGNYNEKTARLYTDISYMTASEEYGADAATFFNTIAGYGQVVVFNKLEAAPLTLRDRLVEYIDGEAERCAQGQPGHIMAKINSLADPDLITALYRAAQAGVRIQLLVRGICTLRPGVPGLSEGIEVISVVDRFLEHSRICYFRHGGDPLYFISSADWMPRNLDRRIELLVPVADPDGCLRLRSILETGLKDNVKGRWLQPDGTYKRPTVSKRARRIRSQEHFLNKAAQRLLSDERRQQAVFKPHRPQ